VFSLANAPQRFFERWGTVRIGTDEGRTIPDFAMEFSSRCFATWKPSACHKDKPSFFVALSYQSSLRKIDHENASRRHEK
jgi:hypothetical protein